MAGRSAGERSGGTVMTETKSDKSDALYCNFCGKSQHEVLVLISGPMAQICDECSDQVSIIVEERRAVRDSAAKQDHSTENC